MKVLYPSRTLSYAITKKSKKFFEAQKWFRVLKLLRLLSDRVLFRVLSDSALFRLLSNCIFFRFLSDRVLFMVLSDRFFFDSSVIGFLKDYSVIDSSFGLSVFFFRYMSSFIKRCHHFFIKNIRSSLHYIFKKTFTLNNQFSMV